MFSSERLAWNVYLARRQIQAQKAVWKYRILAVKPNVQRYLLQKAIDRDFTRSAYDPKITMKVLLKRFGHIKNPTREDYDTITRYFIEWELDGLLDSLRHLSPYTIGTWHHVIDNYPYDEVESIKANYEIEVQSPRYDVDRMLGMLKTESDFIEEVTTNYFRKLDPRKTEEEIYQICNDFYRYYFFKITRIFAKIAMEDTYPVTYKKELIAIYHMQWKRIVWEILHELNLMDGESPMYVLLKRLYFKKLFNLKSSGIFDHCPELDPLKETA